MKRQVPVSEIVGRAVTGIELVGGYILMATHETFAMVYAHWRPTGQSELEECLYWKPAELVREVGRSILLQLAIATAEELDGLTDRSQARQRAEQEEREMQQFEEVRAKNPRLRF